MNKLKHSKRVVICDNPADIDVPDHPYRVQDSGGGRWTVVAAIEGTVPADVPFSAPYARFCSRRQRNFGDNMLSAMRFGVSGYANESMDAEPKPKASQTHPTTQNTAE